MRLDSNPLFRKFVAPWYDSNFTCWLAVAAMLFCAYFSALGISVARQYSAFAPYQHVPWILLVLSLAVALSIVWRLIPRYFDKSTTTHKT